MKDGIVIKGMWLLMGSAMKASLPVLGVSNPRAFWKESKKIYRREMDKLDEYGPNDILKINLAHAVMLSAVYEACDPKLQPEEKFVSAAMSVKEPRRRKRYDAQKRTKSRRQYAEDVRNCEFRYRE